MPADPDAGDARSGFLPLVGNESSSPVMQRNEKFLPRVPTALGFFLLLSASPGSRNFEVHSASIINFFFFYKCYGTPWTCGRLTPIQLHMLLISMPMPTCGSTKNTCWEWV